MHVSTGVVARGSAPQHPAAKWSRVYPFSAVYVNSLTSVGKKFMSLDAFSIRTMNKGVCTDQVEAVTAVTVHNTRATLTPARSILSLLFMLSPPSCLVLIHGSSSYEGRWQFSEDFNPPGESVFQDTRR
jgi:hypothetical protein